MYVHAVNIKQPAHGTQRCTLHVKMTCTEGGPEVNLSGRPGKKHIGLALVTMQKKKDHIHMINKIKPLGSRSLINAEKKNTCLHVKYSSYANSSETNHWHI